VSKIIVLIVPTTRVQPVGKPKVIYRLCAAIGEKQMKRGQWTSER